MSSFLESLPAELLLQIVSSLTLGDISVLMQTCRKLCHDVEPSLYHSQQIRDDALKWACTHGQLNLIRRLITVYELSPSVIDRGLTLNFALRGKRLDAFKLLLDLGARVDDPDESPPLIALVKRLSDSSTDYEFARAFYKAGRAAQLPRRLLDKSLMMMVRADAPIDLVHLVIDQGARVNETHAIGINPHKAWANPLSASILCNSRPVFDALRERGAYVHGTKINTPRRMPLHVPIYAAAYSMLEHGTGLIQACLENGADINHPAVIHNRTSIDRCRYGTPLLGFLDSIKSWPVKTNPTPHIQYLLDRGAILPDNLPAAHFPSPRGYDDQATPHSTLHLLLGNIKEGNRKYNFHQLADAQFQAVTRLLIHHGALSIGSGQQVTAERIKHLLLAYDRPHRSVTYLASVVQAWRSFVTFLLDNASSLGDQKDNGLGQDTLDALLSEYIYTRGTDPNTPPTNLTFEAISVLVSHGSADINATALPTLHKLCHYYHLLEATHNVDPNDAYRRVHDGNPRILQQRRLLVKLLVTKHGADPDLKVCVNGVGEGEGQGKTAEEILLGKRNGGEYSAVGSRFIESLVEQIRDAMGRGTSRW